MFAVRNSYHRNGNVTRGVCSPRVRRASRADKYKSRGRRTSPAPNLDAPADNEALTVASRIASMADRELRQRFHELVDKGLGPGLSVLERFELERIEARLDAEDR